MSELSVHDVVIVRARPLPPIAWWLLAIGSALVLDGAIARAVEPVAWSVKHAETTRLIKQVGDLPFLLIVAGLIALLHPQRWRGAGILMISAIVAGIVYALLKWPVGRPRPVNGIEPLFFEPFRLGLEGFIRGGTSFPSGHVCLAFAMAACLAWLLPRARGTFYAIATVVAGQRVAELAHYASDVVAAAGIGILAFHLTRRAVAQRDIAVARWRAQHR